MRRLAALIFLTLLAVPAAHARKPADVFKGKIVTSAHAFPARFKSDKQFIQHMKKVDKKTFEYSDEGRLSLEFMAFFRRTETGREFTGRLFEITDGQRFLFDFPIYPAQDKNRILAGGTVLRRDELLGEAKDDLNQPEQRKYLLIISRTANSPVLAETKFVINKSAAERAAEKARLEAQKAAAQKLMQE